MDDAVSSAMTPRAVVVFPCQRTGCADWEVRAALTVLTPTRVAAEPWALPKEEQGPPHPLGRAVHQLFEMLGRPKGRVPAALSLWQ